MFLGIDISKDWFDAALLQDGNPKPGHKRFPNNAKGFEQLAAWLKNRKVAVPVHACLEATGTYGQALATFLYEQGHTVSVVNPAQVYHFVQSSLSRAKTDPEMAQPSTKPMPNRSQGSASCTSRRLGGLPLPNCACSKRSCAA